MSTSTMKRIALAAALLGSVGAGAQIIERDYVPQTASPTPRPAARRLGNNRPEGPSRAKRERVRKIARRSRRHNLRLS